MDITFFSKGFILGFLIAAPVGPIGILCIRRSLLKGTLSGLFTGLGAATADACYGAIAAFGLTYISNFLIGQKNLLQIIGIVFLTYLGIKSFFSKPATEAKGDVESAGLVADYFSMLGLTLTNPATIMSFTAVFAGIGITAASDYTSAFLSVFGLFLGSALWYGGILSLGIGLWRNKASDDMLKWISTLSGIIIIGFAIILFVNLVRSA